MYIGVDIGGSKILVAASDDGRELVRQAKIKTPAEGTQGVAELIHLIEKVAEGGEISSIAVAAAGADVAAGGIRKVSPNMHGWSGIQLVKPLKNHFKRPVSLSLDETAAVLTESAIGAGKGYRNVLYVSLSTGVGAGLVINGEPYGGDQGLEAGHIIIDPNGPVCGCGGRGHFEAFASGKAIKRRYGKYGYEITDPKTWDEIAGTMAPGFHSLIVAYSPSVVVIGGGVGVHYDRFHEFLMKHLEALHPMFPLPPVVQAKYIETCVIHGALILASRHQV